MAISAELMTEHGESRELYVRLNNCEVSNHGVDATALFRGFISEEAWKAGKRYVWEREVTFKADVSKTLWKQAYKALRATPMIAVPDEPVAPEPVDDEDATVDQKNQFTAAQARYESDYAAWQKQCEEIEAHNVEVGALGTAVEV